jgi:hypothetical protein
MEATSNSVMEFSVFLKLTEPEARALEAITKYGHKEFLNIYYEKLGKTYLEPHETGLIALFKSIRDEIPPHLQRIDKTRKTFKDEQPPQIIRP